MEAEPASPIFRGIFATTFQISMPTNRLALFGLEVESLQLSRYLTRRSGAVNSGPFVAVVLCRHIVQAGRRISRPFLNPLNRSEVHVDPWVIHQAFDLLV